MPKTATPSGTVAELMRETEYYLPLDGGFVEIAPDQRIAYADYDRVRIEHGYWDTTPTPLNEWRDISKLWEIKRLSATRVITRR